ncbi:MAG: hypothetical protein AB7O26_04125 [Planctomycetaceae bacterium]
MKTNRMACLAAKTLILLSAGMLAPSIATAQQADTSIKILPATKAVAETTPAAPAPADDKTAAPKATMSYEEAYRSIPFSRAEYQANPSYRHDAALEIMFGQLRPTTIVRNALPSTATDYGYNYFDYITPYSYYRRGYGRSYNFFYPRPSVYRRY